MDITQSPSPFARAEGASDDDFLEIEIGGRVAQVFRKRFKGVRSENFYVKGYPPGAGTKAFCRSTGVSTKGLALDAAKKLWRAAIEGRLDVLEKTKIRKDAPVATIGELLEAHEKQIHGFNHSIQEDTARGYRSALRRVVAWAKGWKDEECARMYSDRLADKTDKLSSEVLTEELVEDFVREYLATAGGDVLEKQSRMEGARATMRLARALFAPEALKCYRKLMLPDVKAFLKASMPEPAKRKPKVVTDAIVREMAAAALELRESNPALYLVHLLFRHCGLGNDEIEHAFVGSIVRCTVDDVRGVVLPSGECRPIAAWLDVSWTADHALKTGDREGRISLSADVLAELQLLSRGRDAGELLVPAATKTDRWELINIAHNDFVRPWLGDFSKKSYELRRWSASKVARLQQSDAMASRFLRHAQTTTAGKFYLDGAVPAPITLADCGL